MRCKALTIPVAGVPHADLREIEVPEPGPGEVQVRVHASVISPGTERAFALGLPNTNATFPYHPGYCAAGTVLQAGAGVTKVVPGARVAIRVGHRSAWTLPQSEVFPLPDGISFTDGAHVALGQIAVQGIRRARVELGEPVLVLGLGLIGQLALQCARAAGATPAIGADMLAPRRAAAETAGADAVLDPAADGWRARLDALAGGKGVPVVIEATGAPEPVNLALQCARRLGRVVLLASTRGETAVNFYRDVHHKGVTVIGGHAWAVPARDSSPGLWTMDDDYAAFFRLLSGGRLRLGPLTTHRVPAERAVATYEAMLAGDPDMIGTVIEWA